jgi:S-adenosylmethionine:tRNA ribosyltransferase-isomerase
VQPAFYPTSAFDYELPGSLIATHPAPARDESRLLVVDRSAPSGTIEHRTFRDLAELIPPGDVLVLNETRVMPARLIGKRRGGGYAEILLLQPHTPWTAGPGQEDWPASHIWEGLVRPGA